MKFGSPFAAGFGNPEHHVLYAIYEVAPDGQAVHCRIRPRDGYGDSFWHLYSNARLAARFYAAEGQESLIDLPLRWGETRANILPLRMGHFNDPAYADEKVARLFEPIENNRVTLQFDFVPVVIQPDAEDDEGWTSGWQLEGLVQGVNCLPVSGHSTWGELELEIEMDGADATVNLKRYETIVATGTGTDGGGPFVVTLAPANESGLSGQVTLATGVGDLDGVPLRVRWPKYMRIKRGIADPPTLIVEGVAFGGANTVRWTEPLDLQAGTYYYRLQPISDTGDAGTESGSLSAVIPGIPNPPSALAFASGSAVAGFTVNFTGSSTPGASYRAYMATTIGEPLDPDSPTATAIAGSTSIALPALTGYPGTAYVLIRAVLDGVEERNLNLLAVEFDAAGDFVAARPNSPGIAENGIAYSNGLSIQVSGTYQTLGELGAANTLQLFSRTPGGAYDYENPDDEAELGVERNGVKLATLNHTFSAAGWYYVRLLAATAGGTQSVAASAPEALVYVSAADMPAAANASIEVARG
ncbi:MAG: hypothetical protein HS116_18565 [Planctomycetes bacterium]|nr:hypothetical protein [Planctomycetota bacterium]